MKSHRRPQRRLLVGTRVLDRSPARRLVVETVLPPGSSEGSPRLEIRFWVSYLLQAREVFPVAPTPRRPFTPPCPGRFRRPPCPGRGGVGRYPTPPTTLSPLLSRH